MTPAIAKAAGLYLRELEAAGLTSRQRELMYIGFVAGLELAERGGLNDVDSQNAD